jgi:hypothetical protein
MTTRQLFPDSCIHGLELHDPQAIQQQIAQQDEAALECYHAGLALVRRVRQLLKLQPQLREERAARAFLLHQLRVIEQQHPQAVSAALALFDEQRRGERLALGASDTVIADERIG